MTGSVDHHMTEIYCFMDEPLKRHSAFVQWPHSSYVQLQFSDVEILTMALLQGVFAVGTLKQTYRPVVQNWRPALPSLPSYKQWLARVRHLLPQVGNLLATTCALAFIVVRLYLIDSKPIPVCQSVRQGRVR